jgi:pimeloyl-ACP methyl ester carboxylesterase
MEPIRTRYAKNGDINIAYQVFGEGDVDLVMVPGFISHIENYWDEPRLAQWLRRVGSFSRVILFDKQGTGLSDRSSKLPGMDERMDDVSAVMDAVGIEQAAVFGISEGGSLATLFAASHPDRSQALILYGAFAKFTSWFPTQEALESLFQYIDSAWGSGESLPMFAPTMKDDLALKEWWGKFERLGGSPGAAKTIMSMNSQIDITDILPSVNVPTLIIHRRDDVTTSGSRMQNTWNYPGLTICRLSARIRIRFSTRWRNS